MTRIAALLLVLTSSCGSTTGTAPRINAAVGVGFSERFSEVAIDPGWVAAVPNVAGASARLERGSICLTMPSGSEGDVIVRRKFDVSGVRGWRLRLVARVRTDAPAQSSASATMTVSTNDAFPSYGSGASTRKVNSEPWTSIHTIMDVASNATSGELVLSLRGPGRAWFDDVEVTAVGVSPLPASVRLSDQQVADLVTFTRAAALIRYLHPSDQAATLDWNELFPSAIDRLLRRDPQKPLIAHLQEMFSTISPTVVFSSSSSAARTVGPPRQDGSHLARWRRYGLGTSPPYSTYREGRDPDTTYAIVSMPLQIDNLQHCKTVSVRAYGRKLDAPGTMSLIVGLRLPGVEGVESKEVSKPWEGAATELTVAVELPQDTRGLNLSMRIDGQSGAVVSRITWSCDNASQRSVDLVSGTWALTGLTDLYTWELVGCGSGTCAQFRRNPLDTDFVTQRDAMHANLGNGVAIDVPLAVWANAAGTLPVVSGAPLRGDFAINDVAMRLSVISSAWGTLSLFYPYFKDQNTDWLAVLPDALKEAAAARSARETHAALAHLVARLRDNHARVTHPAAPATGVLPVTFRRFGTKIIVTGGLPEYTKDVPPGSELLELDGVAAIHAYQQAAANVSAATEGLREYLAPIRMGMAAPGTFRRLRVRKHDGATIDRVVSLVPRDLYLHTNRETRPEQGRELAPGLYYLDFEQLQSKELVRLMPALERARALVFDFRGFVNSSAAEVLSRIASHDLHSPTWQIPRVHSTARPEYSNTHWDIRPRSPRLPSKIVVLVDGRSMSSAETILQIIQENQLGVFVGEPSGGTNGNVNSFQTPGGFEVRFTGMRVAGKDGTTIQGRGITPDHVVAPTLEGVRAGRDEILEAGIAVAQRLLNP